MLERKKEYYWQSTKDGTFHLLKLNSVDKFGNYKLRVLEKIHDGWLTKRFTQKTNCIITIDKDKAEELLYTDFGAMQVDYMYKIAITQSFFEYEKSIYFYRDLIDLLNHYPDKYLKYIEKLMNNPLFRKVLKEGVY